ncbi:MAG: sigma-70 family RNA polymerase sigma factor [Ardenticatenaceae bacterium]
MENERLEQYRGVVPQVLARRGWGLVQDEEAFMAEVLEDAQRRLTQQRPQSPRPLAKVIEDATINRYGHIWHAACAASGTLRQHQAFTELHQHLFRVAYRVVDNNEYLAQESAQEALISISKNLSEMNDPGRFLRWVNVIVSREASKRRKKAWDLPEIQESDLARPDDPDAEGSKLERLMESSGPPPSDTQDVRAKFEEVIKRCLKRSKEGSRVIIRLLLDQRTVKQVANELGQKPSNIYRITHKAKNGLRKCQDFLTLAKTLHLIDSTVA